MDNLRFKRARLSQSDDEENNEEDSDNENDYYKEDWETREITSLNDVIELFPGFKIPYYYSHANEIQITIKHI